MATINVNAARMMLWEGDTTTLTSPVTKGRVPGLPLVGITLQTVTSVKPGVLSYLMLQILKSTDKQVIMRALASAVAYLLNDTTNMTGSATSPDLITGLDAVADASVDGATVLQTNFNDAEDVTKDDIVLLSAADLDEIGAFFGLMFIAGNKRITPENRTAFNERRQSAATAGVIGDAMIFTTNSIYLPDSLMQKMNACFVSMGDVRANLTAKIIPHLGNARMGPAQAFANFFLLLADSGMGGLRTIRVVLGRYPWARAAFPELRPQIEAANTAFKLISTANESFRPFLKAIHGNHFVPVSFSQIDNLVGVCRRIEMHTNPTFKNYAGGSITESQEDIIARHLETTDEAETPET